MPIINILLTMSSAPDSMRSGIPHPNNPDDWAPIVLNIVLLILHGILRRNGLSDSLLYAKHNLSNKHTYQLWESGVVFNLLSPQGVGIKLKPIIKELFSLLALDPDKWADDPFYKEIIKYTPEVTILVKKRDERKQSDWLTKYALLTKDDEDHIYTERNNRLSGLLPLDNNYSDNKVSPCRCQFCCEFRPYLKSHPQNSIELVNKALLSISESVYRN